MEVQQSYVLSLLRKALKYVMEQSENWYGLRKLASLSCVGDLAMTYWSSDEQPLSCPS